MQIDYISEPINAQILVDGVPVASVERYKVVAQRGVIPIEVCGEQTQKALPESSVKYTLQLHSIKLMKDMEVDIFGLSDFEIQVTYQTTGSVYSGCQWQRIEQSMSDGDVSCDATVVSYQRRAYNGE